VSGPFGSVVWVAAMNFASGKVLVSPTFGPFCAVAVAVSLVRSICWTTYL
jgi:hypothetical protein